MKKIFLLAVVLVMGATGANAQWFIDGAVGFKSEGAKAKMDDRSYDGTLTQSFKIAPSINYMISDKFAIGLELAYTFDKTDPRDAGNTITKTNMFLFGPRLSYFGRITDWFYYNPSLSIGFGFGKLTQTDSKDVKLTGFGGGISFLNFEIRPVSKLGITFDLGSLTYLSSTNKVDGSDDKGINNSFALNINPLEDLQVGVRLYF